MMPSPFPGEDSNSDFCSSNESVQSDSVCITTKTCTYLPVGYKLQENDVYCGRGKSNIHHIGNRRFRMIIAANIDRYCNAETRNEKIALTYEVVDHIRSMCREGGNGIGFLKIDRKTHCYYEVGDLIAREKVSQSFRDASHRKYMYSKLVDLPRNLKPEVVVNRIDVSFDKTEADAEHSPKEITDGQSTYGCSIKSMDPDIIHLASLSCMNNVVCENKLLCVDQETVESLHVSSSYPRAPPGEDDGFAGENSEFDNSRYNYVVQYVGDQANHNPCNNDSNIHARETTIHNDTVSNDSGSYALTHNTSNNDVTHPMYIQVFGQRLVEQNIPNPIELRHLKSRCNLSDVRQRFFVPIDDHQESEDKIKDMESFTQCDDDDIDFHSNDEQCARPCTTNGSSEDDDKLTFDLLLEFTEVQVQLGRRSVDLTLPI